MDFSGWLRARRPEIEGVALARVVAVADPDSVGDPEHVPGLRVAISAALDYGFVGIEFGEERAGPVPAGLLTQTRNAARSGVSLDTILRRCIAGNALLGDFAIQAIEDSGLALYGPELQRIWRIQTALLDRLVTAVTAEYRRQAKRRLPNAEERRAACVRRLLAGQFLEADELTYEFDAWHIAAVARGRGAEGVLKGLAEKLDRHLLLVHPGGRTLWAWLGGRREISTKDIEGHAPSPWPSDLSLAIGESERGMAGWRLSHRQAKAAAPIALRPQPRMIRYSDVALLASALQDEVLASSLQRLYLDPLAYERDGGATLRHTLRAYFLACRQVSSTAAVLGVSRQTVAVRLRTIEERIGRSLDGCASEMDTALRMQELNPPLAAPVFA